MYGYDAESHPTSIAQGSNPVASYAYDAQGRRKSKTVGSATTIYVTDADDREVLEYNGTSGAIGAWYAYGTGPNAVLSRMTGAGTDRATLIPDVQGSIIATLDAASGSLAKAGYQAFGENPTTYTGTFRYAAQRIDPETGGSSAQPSGLYYDRARMYSPTWGRFLQPDPIGYQGGNNLYAYVENDPLNGTDPSGNCPMCVMAVGAAVGGAIGGGVDAVIQGIHIYTGAQTSFNGVEFGAAVGAGAITGSGAGLLGEAGLGLGIVGRTIGNAVIGSAVNTGQTAVVNSYGGGNGSLAWAPAFGALGGGGGSLLGDAFNGANSALSQSALDTVPLSDKLTALYMLQMNPGAGASAAAVSGGDVVSGVVGGIVTGEQPEK